MGLRKKIFKFFWRIQLSSVHLQHILIWKIILLYIFILGAIYFVLFPPPLTWYTYIKLVYRIKLELCDWLDSLTNETSPAELCSSSLNFCQAQAQTLWVWAELWTPYKFCEAKFKLQDLALRGVITVKYITCSDVKNQPSWAQDKLELNFEHPIILAFLF